MPIYTKADAEALCAIAIAGAQKQIAMDTECIERIRTAGEKAEQRAEKAERELAETREEMLRVAGLNARNVGDLKEAEARLSASGEPTEAQEEVKDRILAERDKGNLTVLGIEGMMTMPVEEFVKQPVDGMLYDLNRGEEVSLTFLHERKWVNDFAVALVIRKLVEQRDAALSTPAEGGKPPADIQDTIDGKCARCGRHAPYPPAHVCCNTDGSLAPIEPVWWKAKIVRVDALGLGFVEVPGRQFAFTFDRIDGYRGQYPKEIGLREGAEVRVQIVDGKVHRLSLDAHSGPEQSK